LSGRPRARAACRVTNFLGGRLSIRYTAGRVAETRGRAVHEPMDEVDRLAHKVLDAFDDIPELRLEWLIVPDAPRRGSVLEMEVAATETSFASRGIEVRAKVAVPLEDVRALTTNELRRFFARELLERGGYGRAVAEARVIGEAATRGVPAPGEAQKN
jgi:hypothetical protein